MLTKGQKVVEVAEGADPTRVIQVQEVTGDADRVITLEKVTGGDTGRYQRIQIVSGGDLSRVQRVQFTTSDAGDPDFASVVLLLGNDNAADGTTTFTDQSGSAHTITPAGNVQYDSAQAPTGMTTSAVFDGTGDHLTAAAHADFTFGTGDWTIEFEVRVAVINTTMVFFDNRASGLNVNPACYVSTAEAVVFDVAGNARITGTAGAIAADTWYHIAICKASGTTKLFIDGTQQGSSYTDGNDYVEGPFRIGAINSGGTALNGWISNFRVTKGVARYTDNFTPPTLPLPTS